MWWLMFLCRTVHLSLHIWSRSYCFFLPIILHVIHIENEYLMQVTWIEWVSALIYINVKMKLKSPLFFEQIIHWIKNHITSGGRVFQSLCFSSKQSRFYRNQVDLEGKEWVSTNFLSCHWTCAWVQDVSTCLWGNKLEELLMDFFMWSNQKSGVLVDMCWTRICLSPNSTRGWPFSIGLEFTTQRTGLMHCHLLVCASCTSYYPSLCATSLTSIITKCHRAVNYCFFRETVLQWPPSRW